MKKLQLKGGSSYFRGQEAREAAFALKIRQHLHHSSESLSHDITERLKVVRERALDQRKKESEALVIAPSMLYVKSGTTVMSQIPRWKQGLTCALPVLVLFLALFAANQWQEEQRINELAEIDALILADDLPLNAHLDPGFIATLQSSE